MAGQYSIVIKGRDGVKRAEIIDMLSLAYTRRVNAPALVTFDLRPEHPAIATLELDGQIEVWRRDTAMGVAWHADAGYLYRGSTYAVPQDQDEVFSATCPGQLHWLSRRIIAYNAGKTGYTAITGPAETVMRTIVATNCTSIATAANGRDRDGVMSQISVEADQGRGLTVPWAGTRKNVLSELQNIAQPTVGGCDFDLIKTGPASWVFRVYPGQLGTDRSTGSNAVVFSRDFDNMGQPRLVYDRVDEKTVAIVGGAGEENARRIYVTTGADYSAADDIELFVDARNAPTALATAGRRALDEARARPMLTFMPLQTPQTFYGKQYFLGDLVRASYRGLTSILKVVAATITLSRDGAEDIQVELALV
jgi:hypothetical protein